MAKKIVQTSAEIELARKIEDCMQKLLKVTKDLEDADNMFPVDMTEQAEIYFANSSKQVQGKNISEETVQNSYTQAINSVKDLKNAYANLRSESVETRIVIQQLKGKLAVIEDLLREVEVIRREIQGIEFSNEKVAKNTKSAFVEVLQGFANIVVFLRTSSASTLNAAKNALGVAGVVLDKVFSPIKHLVKKTQIFSGKKEKTAGIATQPRNLKKPSND